MKKIDRLEKGKGTKTLLHAEKGNELIDVVNSILDLVVEPSSAGEFKFANGHAVLDLKKRPQHQPATGLKASYPWQPIAQPKVADAGGVFFKVSAGFAMLGAAKIPINHNQIFFAPSFNSIVGWAACSIHSPKPEQSSLSSVTVQIGSMFPSPPSGNSTTGAPPSVFYVPLFLMTTGDGVIERTDQLMQDSFCLGINVSGIRCPENDEEEDDDEEGGGLSGGLGDDEPKEKKKKKPILIRNISIIGRQ